MSLNIVWDNKLIDPLARNIEVITDVPYGAISTADTPSLGAFATGSQVPAGRFVAWSPQYMAAKRSEYRSIILPDKLGTSLLQNDMVTDFTDIIASAFNAAGEFEIAGVSILSRACHPLCVGGCNQDTLPHKLISPQPAPIGYYCRNQLCNYYDIYQAVSVATEDYIAVYTEVDIKPGDEMHIRVEIIDAVAVHPNGAPVQLFGGITNVADAGTQMYTKARYIRGAVAGSSVIIELD